MTYEYTSTTADFVIKKIDKYIEVNNGSLDAETKKWYIKIIKICNTSPPQLVLLKEEDIIIGLTSAKKIDNLENWQLFSEKIKEDTETYEIETVDIKPSHRGKNFRLCKPLVKYTLQTLKNNGVQNVIIENAAKKNNALSAAFCYLKACRLLSNNVYYDYGDNSLKEFNDTTVIDENNVPKGILCIFTTSGGVRKRIPKSRRQKKSCIGYSSTGYKRNQRITKSKRHTQYAIAMVRKSQRRLRFTHKYSTKFPNYNHPTIKM